MLRILVLGLTVVAGAATYVASPFVTMWSIREAVRTGDKAYLAHKIEWDTFKASLKDSLARMAFQMPEPTEADPLPKTSLWQRLKAHYGQGMVDRFVDSTVTPEGLPSLFSYKKAYNEKVLGAEDEAKTRTVLERVKRTWARVKHAEFLTPTRFRIVMQDKNMPDRLLAGVLELRPSGWKLVEMRVKSTDGTGQLAAADATWR